MGVRKSFLGFLAVALSTVPVYGQSSAIKTYLQMAGAPDFFSAPQRDARHGKSSDDLVAAYSKILPARKAARAFFVYANASASQAQLFADSKTASNAVAQQFNKLLGSSVGSSGTTSLASGSAVSSILSLGMEYGAITESNSGNVATLRTNLFALAQPLVGGSALPVCTESSKISPCNGVSRWLRKFSASYSAETSGTGTATATGANAQTGVADTTNIFAGGYRTAGWSARMDWFAANPYKVATDKFMEAMKTVEPSVVTLEGPVVEVVDELNVDSGWETRTIMKLEGAQNEADAEKDLDAALNELVTNARMHDTDFDTKVDKALAGYAAYYNVLDTTIQGLQTNKFSTEFTSQHPLGQANTSNLRVIYSWQPTKTPLLFTFNGAVTWYNSIPADVKPGTVGRLRDAQFSAQVDRKIGSLASIKNSVITLAGYYQWQLENALITIDDGTVAPGTGITLPGSAATLLAPKGNIAIAQLKWTLPIMNGVVKIPFSFTWSNRTELIDESEKRGQVGITLDLDAVFAKGSQ